MSVSRHIIEAHAHAAFLASQAGVRSRQAQRRAFTFYGDAAKLQNVRASQVMFSGPAECGKTLASLSLLDRLCWEVPGLQAAIVRQTYQSMKGSVLQTYEQKILPKGSPVVPYGGEKPEWYDYPNGSRVWIGGMDKPERVLSSERDLIYVNQAEELSQPAWETLSTRCTGRAGNLRDESGVPFGMMLGDCNPAESTHWIKQKFDLGEWDGWLEARHEDNPTLFNQITGEITEQGRRALASLDRLTGARKERLRHGRWSSAEGVVYDEFERRTHVIAQLPFWAVRRYVAGVDWGYTKPGVISVWGLDGDLRMYRAAEFYHTQKLLAGANGVDGWWIKKAKEVFREFRIEQFVCDPAEPEYIKTFAAAGLPVEAAYNDIKLGIQNVQARLKVQADGRARLFFVENTLRERDEELVRARQPFCTEQEMEVYAYPKGSDGKPVKELPVDDVNHGCDATRYAAAYVDGLSRRGQGTRQHSYTGGASRG